MKILCLPISAFCKTGSGTTPSRNKYERYFNGSIPWVKSGELRESIITETEERVTEEALAETSLKIAPKGSVLVAMYGANVGRVGILGINATTNQAVCYLIPEKDKADSRYVFHALQQKLPEFISRSVGGAQPNISQQIIRATKILLPPLEEQKRIAQILDRAEELRSKRREAIAQLDSLTQAIFIEMFGDPVTNPKGFTLRKIKDLLESASYGTSEKSSSEGEFPVLRMNNITRTGEIDLTDLKYMDLADRQKERYLVRSGDVLFNRTNSAELVGKTAIIRNISNPMAFAGYLVRLRVNKENDPEYLSAFLNTDYSKRVLRGMCKSIIGMANINATEVQTINIAQPPLPLQKEFARRVEAVEKLKTAHRASLSELDALFGSLQHRAFRGEL
ncbi:restriction endonuclease subunit S [Microcoleus sp. AT3-D2]|uniref:restriction endonuclease subunit S n=1 Tax=Microcoleus sp. AT3-D2 TaxID=2818612 RepID=UPI002FD381B1